MHINRPLIVAANLFLIYLFSSAPCFAGQIVKFDIVERLGRSWRNERLSFPLPKGAQTLIASGAALATSGGVSTPVEVAHGSEGDTIEFIANLEAWGQETFELTNRVAPAQSDLHVEEDNEQLRLFTDKAGIAISKRLFSPNGFEARFRLADGKWSTALFQTDASITNFEAHADRRGPVLGALVIEAHFGPDIVWRARIALQAGEQPIIFEENWSSYAHPAVKVRFDETLRLGSLYFRRGGGGAVGQVASEPLPEKTHKQSFEIVPWLHWWLSEHRGIWAVAYGEGVPDALLVAALNAADWIATDVNWQQRTLNPIVLDLSNEGVTINLPKNGVRRNWLIAFAPADELVDKSLIGKSKAPPAQRLVVKHGDHSLNLIKNYTLDWPADDKQRARLILRPEDFAIAATRPPANPKDLERVLKTALSPYSMGDFVDMGLRPGGEAALKKLSEAATTATQKIVDALLDEDELMSLGFAPHRQYDIIYAVHLADFALADASLPEDVKSRIRSQLAFVGYTVNRADYWSPERGLAANPNMTTTVANYRGFLGCLLRDHPSAKPWLDASLKELFDTELMTWSDPAGGWLEAPHYATVTFDHMLGVFVCARNAGRPEYLLHPRTRLVMEWLARITTPPDIRNGGHRSLPPIGNTYMLEPTGEFGLVAYLFRNIDPSFSAEMEWMHHQSGDELSPGVGGFFPAMAPYQRAFKSISLPATPPDYGSHLFPKTGAILRTHFGGLWETQLHIISGGNHAHYDNDSGSVTLWGKGRLLANDFGYYGYAAAADHSMIDIPGSSVEMRTQAFSSLPSLDYFEGTAGPWTRSIVFVKDTSAAGPNYFVIRDKLQAKAGVWRLWLSADDLQIDGRHVLVSGREDVDMDIFFVTGIRTPRLEKKTRTSVSSIFGNMPFETTQTGVFGEVAGPADVVTVLLYPRIKGEARPTVSAEMDGRVIFVSAPSGLKDIIFLSDAPYSYEGDGVTFEGKAGAVIGRNGRVELSLGTPGKLEAYGRRAPAPGPNTP